MELGKMREVRPGQAKLRLGIKVGGEASWLVAKSAAEVNFEICDPAMPVLDESILAGVNQRCCGA
jgi:hypothetical protein